MQSPRNVRRVALPVAALLVMGVVSVTQSTADGVTNPHAVVSTQVIAQPSGGYITKQSTPTVTPLQSLLVRR